MANTVPKKTYPMVLSEFQNSYIQMQKISVQQLAWKATISHNVKGAVETAIINIIEDVIANAIEEEQCRKK